jgi:protein-tyrosine phosphatase
MVIEMQFSLILNILVIILTFFILLAVYLWWQSSIKPAPFHVMFAVRHGEGSQVDERIIPLEGATNFRDLGGYETVDGRFLAWGRVYRSASLTNLTASDLNTLLERGIHLICDLRTYTEVKEKPDKVPQGVTYRHMPVFPKDPIGIMGVVFRRHKLVSIFDRMYRHSIIDNGAIALGNLLKLFTDMDNLPILFHCTSGKDRTGVASALLLYILGVDRETIVADYSLTNLSIERVLENIRVAFSASRPPPGLKLEQMYPILSARPEIIEQAFEYIENNYGSIDRYLRGPVGMNDADFEAIRCNLLV